MTMKQQLRSLATEWSEDAPEQDAFAAGIMAGKRGCAEALRELIMSDASLTAEQETDLFGPPDIQVAFQRLMAALGNGSDAVQGLEEIVETVSYDVSAEAAQALSDLFDAIMANDPRS
jgi:hypothetical protein